MTNGKQMKALRDLELESIGATMRADAFAAFIALGGQRALSDEELEETWFMLRHYRRKLDQALDAASCAPDEKARELAMKAANRFCDARIVYQRLVSDQTLQ